MLGRRKTNDAIRKITIIKKVGGDYVDGGKKVSQLFEYAKRRNTKQRPWGAAIELKLIRLRNKKKKKTLLSVVNRNLCGPRPVLKTKTKSADFNFGNKNRRTKRH